MDFKSKRMLPNYYIYGFELKWYVFWQWTAIIVTILFALWYFKYKKPETTLLNILVLTPSFLLLGYLGARLFSCIDRITSTGKVMSWAELLNAPTESSLRWYGAILFILLGLPILTKIFRIKNFAHSLDFLALNLCLFTAIVKQACLFAGDGCYGIYTSLPWGMYFPYGSSPNILPVHPTPLYDTLFHLFFFFVLYKWNQSSRKKYVGQTAIFFFMGTALFNIAIEFIRRNPDIVMGLTLSQITYSLILLITLSYYLVLTKKQHLSFSPI